MTVGVELSNRIDFDGGIFADAAVGAATETDQIESTADNIGCGVVRGAFLDAVGSGQSHSTAPDRTCGDQANGHVIGNVVDRDVGAVAGGVGVQRDGGLDIKSAVYQANAIC